MSFLASSSTLPPKTESIVSVFSDDSLATMTPDVLVSDFERVTVLIEVIERLPGESRWAFVSLRICWRWLEGLEPLSIPLGSLA